MGRKIPASAFALALSLHASAALAQESGDKPAPVPATVPAPVPGAQSRQMYTPQDFARFAPKTAYDMLSQVPGFTIRGADSDRGLGQASENVLINGQRIANKSGGAIDQLQRTPANQVARIEIVDAASLGIAGLVGQVANIVLAETKTGSGQFQWQPQFRPHFARPQLYRGSVSYSSKIGPVDYTLSVRDQGGYGASGGPIVITDATGKVIETRDEINHSESDTVTFQGQFVIHGPGTSEGNLSLGYSPYWGPFHDVDVRTRIGGDTLTRITDFKNEGWLYDISGDYSFALGSGRLKLLGLHHFDHEPFDTVQVTSFASGAPDQGIEFRRNSHIMETVFRGEYSVKAGANDFQLSLERAFNSLNQHGSLLQLNGAGQFVEVPFPEGSGHVREVRYEGIATWSRPLAKNVSLQLALGAEQSQLARVDGDVPPREFFRPKGSLTLGWLPNPLWDLSLKLRRRVGQISFYDFLAQPNLQQERENTGNPDLVPPQSWEGELEVSRNLGAWGKTRVRLYGHLIEDIVDIIPIGTDGEAVGNLPSAHRYGVEWVSTFNLDPAGIKGAKINLTIGFEHTDVRDPLSGETRQISGNHNRWVNFAFRHDIPQSDFAYGVFANHDYFARNYYLSEVNRGWEGPVFAGVYVEDKNVFGLTVRAQAGNLLNARHRFERTVYDGRRLRDPVLYNQSTDQLIGPIFQFLVKGTF
jgi:hypothetical protein